MALKATIYKADLQIADMDRHYYADHALTIARHPSETDERMMARVLAYSSSCDVWWKQIAGKLTRFTNLTVLQLPAETSQALAALAERGMRLQCMGQDGEIWINTDTER